jgi:hypothetical protein
MLNENQVFRSGLAQLPEARKGTPVKYTHSDYSPVPESRQSNTPWDPVPSRLFTGGRSVPGVCCVYGLCL